MWNNKSDDPYLCEVPMPTLRDGIGLIALALLIVVLSAIVITAVV